MESLFSQRKPKRGLVGLMLAGSLVLHGGLVGIASLWTPPQPAEGSVIIIDDAPPEGPAAIDPRELPQPFVSESPETTATPTLVETAVDTPPPSSEEPAFYEPAEATPPRHVTVAKPAASNRPASAPSATRQSAGPAGGGIPGNGSPAAGVTGTWVMPHPPFPHMANRPLAVGQTTVRVTTDASGRVSNVVILKSAGNPLLDSHTASYVRNNWHGPSNASRTTEFVYELR